MQYSEEDIKLRDHCEQRKSSMVKERTSFEPLWDDISQHVRPGSARIGITLQPSKGWRKDHSIIDPTATLASRSLRSGMMAGLTSPARPWFKLTTPDPALAEHGAAKAWLYHVESTMRDAFTKSNLYQVLPMVYGDCGDFATACMSCLEDDKTILRFNHYLVGQYFLAVNDHNRVDTIYRVFPMTVRQVVQKYGLKNCTSSVQSQFNAQQYETEVEITHVIEPNTDADKFKVDNGNKPFRSLYYENNADYGLFLRKGGFDEFPNFAPRWDLYDDSCYGTACPGIDSLGTNKALQLSDKRETQAVDWWVRPHMLVDSSLQNDYAGMHPGGHTYVPQLQQHNGARALRETNPSIKEIDIKIQRYQEQIRRCYFEDMMQMLAQSDNPEMTAREIEERHAEKVLILGPVMERMNDELFDPLIERSFGIMMRRGLIPPPPQSLQGQQLKIEYTSILAQAQKLLGTANIEKVSAFVGSLAGMDQKALDKFDVDEAIDTYAEMHGINPNIIRSAEMVQGLRDARAKQQQAAMLQQMAKPMGDAAKGMKAMGDTNLDNIKEMAGMLQGQ